MSASKARVFSSFKILYPPPPYKLLILYLEKGRMPNSAWNGRHDVSSRCTRRRRPTTTRRPSCGSGRGSAARHCSTAAGAGRGGAAPPGLGWEQFPGEAVCPGSFFLYQFLPFTLSRCLSIYLLRLLYLSPLDLLRHVVISFCSILSLLASLSLLHRIVVTLVLFSPSLSRYFSLFLTHTQTLYLSIYKF